MIVYKVTPAGGAKARWYTDEDEAIQAAVATRGRAEKIQVSQLNKSNLTELLNLGDDFPAQAHDNLVSREVLVDVFAGIGADAVNLEPDTETESEKQLDDAVVHTPADSHRKIDRQSATKPPTAEITGTVDEVEAAIRRQEELLAIEERKKARGRQIRAVLIALLLVPPLGVAGWGAWEFYNRWSFDRITAPEFFERAISYEQEGKFGAAVIEHKNVIQRDASHRDARWHLAQIYLQQGSGAAALEQLNQVILLGKTGRDVELAKLQAQQLLGLHQEIILEVKNSPAAVGDVDYILLLARAQIGIEEYQGAQETIDGALASSLSSANLFAEAARLALIRDEPKLAREQISLALEIEPDNYEAQVMLGHALMRELSYAEAEKVFVRALKTPGNVIAAQFGLTRSLLSQGRYEAASAVLNAIANNHPRNATVHYLKALIAWSRDDLEAATSALADSLSLNRKHPLSLIMSAQLNLRQSQFEKTISFAKRYLLLTPRDPDALKIMAAARIQLDDLPGALANLLDAQTSAPQDLEILTMLSQVYSRQGQYDESLRTLEHAMALAPEKPSIRTQIAGVYFATGQEANAFKELITAREIDPRYTRADMILLLSSLRHGSYEIALEAAEELARKQPDNPFAYYFKAVAYARQGQSENAREWFQVALDTEPSFSAATMSLAALDVENNDIEAAKARYSSLLDSQDPVSANSARMQLASLAQDNQQWNEARLHYEQILEKAPQDEAALLGLATALAATEQTADALSTLGDARDRNQSSAVARAILSNYFQRNGNAAEAIKYAKEAYQIEPNDPTVLLVLGRAQLMVNETILALKTLTDLVALQPNSPDALYQLGVAFLRNGDETRAREEYLGALEIDSAHLPALLGIGYLLLSQADHESAKNIARQVTASYPTQAAGYELAGDALRAEKQWDAALRAYGQAASLDPSGFGFRKIHSTLIDSGAFEQAQQALNTWVENHPDDLDAKHMMASSFMRGGDVTLARETYETIVSIDENDAGALNNLSWLVHKSDPPRALALARRAYAAAPANADVIDTYGWMLVLQERAEEGLRLLELASRQLPQNEEVKWHLAVALKETGEFERSKGLLREFVAAGESSEFSEQAKEMLDWGFEPTQ